MLAIGVASLIVVTGPTAAITRMPSSTASPKPGSVSEASSSAPCSLRPTRFHVS